MDHRYNPGFRDYIQRQARWATKHNKCLTEIIHQRPGTHICSCGLQPEYYKYGAQLRIGSVLADVQVIKVERGKSVAYICVCGEKQSCACSPSPVNYAARLFDQLTGDSVADSDFLVEKMTDDEAAQYGTLRDAFLREQTVKYRSIERARKRRQTIAQAKAGRAFTLWVALMAR